jgi:hypothetical protein
MVAPWLAAAVAVPVVITKGILSVRSRHHKDIDSDRLVLPTRLHAPQAVPCTERKLHICRDDATDSPFVCERVCASDRLLKRLGNYAKVMATTVRPSRAAA